MRVPKIFSRVRASGNRHWYVRIDGKQVALGSDETAAKREYKMIVLRLNAGEPGQSMRLGSLVGRYLDWSKKHHATATYHEHARILTDLVDYLPQRIAVEAITRGNVIEWLEAHPRWHNGGRRSAISSLSACLRWAIERELIERNPIAEIKRPPKGKRKQVVSDTAMTQILAGIDSDAFRDVVLFAIEQGARPEEIRKIEARQYDCERGLIVLQVDEHKTGAKTQRKRIIYLTEASKEIVERLIASHKDGPIFCDEVGKPWTRHTISSRFRTLYRRGLPRISIYALRHTYVTRGLAKGLSDSMVAELAGHSDPSMVQRVYGHLVEEVDAVREAARRLGR